MSQETKNGLTLLGFIAVVCLLVAIWTASFSFSTRALLTAAMFIGLVVAHTVLNVPLVMMVMGVAIREFDLRIEQVAWSLGASWRYTVAKVVLPNLAPSVFAAWIFAFIGSFDEVIVTSFIAGRYETVPKKMFNELILEVNPTITAVATLLIGLTVLALAAVTVILGRAGKLRPTLA